MRDVMTGEYYDDDPDRDWTLEPVLLGRWAYIEKRNRDFTAEKERDSER